jgi:hypothetical protein
MYKFKPRTTRGHGGGHATELAGGITINGDMGKYFEKKKNRRGYPLVI